MAGTAAVALPFALFACLVVVVPCAQCAADGSHQSKKAPQQVPGLGHSEGPLDIPRAQKKLGREVAALRKTTSHQTDQLNKAIESLETKIYKISSQLGNAKSNEKDWAEIQKEAGELLKSLNMEMGPAELSAENIRKTIEKMKEFCNGEIGKIDAEDRGLRDRLGAQRADLEAKALAKIGANYAKEIEETRKQLKELTEKYIREYGQIEELEGKLDLFGGENAARSELRNEVIHAKSSLEWLKEKSATLYMNHPACADEKALMEAASAQFWDRIEKLDRQPMRKKLDQIGHLERSLDRLEHSRRHTRPVKAKELHKMEEMQGDLDGKRAELGRLKLRKQLEDALEELVQCLDKPLTDQCKMRKEKAAELGEHFKQMAPMEGPNEGHKSGGLRKPSLLESFGEFLGIGDHEKKLSQCLADVSSVYQKAAAEGRKKMEATFFEK